MENYGSFDEVLRNTASLNDVSGSSGFSFPVVNMMAPIDRVGGYDIHMPKNDHEPPHIEIKKGSQKFGKLPLNPEDKNSLTYRVEGIPAGDLRKLERRVIEMHDEYLKKWKETREEGN